LSIPKAVANLAIPTIISQLVTMVYNLADTFFVGQTGDPNQVAAVTLAFPAFWTLSALASLLGVGGSSLISRSLGAQKPARARQTSVFCVFSAIAVTLFYSLLVLIIRRPFLALLGAGPNTEAFTNDYLFWVLVIGGVPTVLGMVFGHLVRAEGGAKQASIGMSLGGILNIVLDPIFILTMGMGIKGAAIATMISNVATVCYFLVYLHRTRGKTIISVNPGNFKPERELAAAVISVGLPAALQTCLSVVSNTTLNKLASAYGETAIAAVGIVKKIDMLPMNVTLGLSQGVLPLIGYNYAAKNYRRMKKTSSFTRIVAVSFSLFCVLIFELFANQIVDFFIRDTETVRLGADFLRILCLTTPMMAISFLIITMFQAVGKGKHALVLSIFRKGSIDIPLMILMDRLIPLYGLLCVQPMVDTLSVVLAFTLYRGFSKGLAAQGER
jgi:multidrug efflux pump